MSRDIAPSRPRRHLKHHFDTIDVVRWPFVGRDAALLHVLETVEPGIGVALLGSAGVGKSRLLAEAVRRAQQPSRPAITVIATQSARSIPFAPFVNLLPSSPTQNSLALLGATVTALQAQIGPRGLLLALDDAHNLDEGSLSVVIHCLGIDGITVCLTARTGEPMSSDLVDLWTNGAIQRIDVLPLDRDDSRLLLAEVLGETDPRLEEELWELACGNPLVLHEVVEGAMGNAIEQDQDKIWRQTGNLAESTRLADLVNARLSSLPKRLHLGMELVALGAPIPSRVLHAVLGDTVEELESRTMISTVEVSGETAIVAAHPLYGEILSANLDGLRRQHVYRTLVEAANTAGWLEDPLRVATWQLESGLLADPELAIQGANAALIRHDPVLAEKLVRPVAVEDDRAGLVLARTLSYQQRFAEAEDMLAAMEQPPDSSFFLEVVSVRAQNLAFGLGRIDEARALLKESAHLLEDDQQRARLNNERALISAIRGDFVDAKRATQEVLHDDRSGDVAKVTAYVTLTLAQSMTGDVEGLNRIIDEAVSRARMTLDDLPFAEDQIQITHMVSLLHEGRISEAVALGRSATGPDDRGTAMKPTWLSAYATTLDLAGQLQQAARASEAALALYQQADPFGLEAQTRGVLALVSGQMGDADASLSVEGIDLAIRAPRLAVWLDRGRAWAAVAQGDEDEATEILLSGGRNAVEGEHFAWGCVCFHDCVRLGRADLVINEMRSLDFQHGARLMTNMKKHGETLLGRDGDGLLEVGTDFMGMGAPLLAASSWAQAASLFDGDEPASAARAAVLSMIAEGFCERPKTPTLLSRPDLVSRRETEVVVEALKGRSSGDIGHELHISVRTVDNHLHHVYQKMGVSSRDELAFAFAPVIDAVSTDMS